VTEPARSWKSDRRVRSLLERNMDEGESIRFVIEGMDGQCIVALDERLLVVKPGSAIDERHSGLTTSIPYSDITRITVTEGPSNREIKIHTSDYQPTEVNTGQGLLESNAFSLSDDPTSIPVAKWALDSKYRAHLLELSELAREAGETPQKSMGINSSSTDTQPKGE
jgi:Bacterial PH domain